MHSVHNDGKSVIVQKFIRMLKNKIYKYATSISKNLYIDELDDIVSKYDNIHQSTTTIKPADVKSNAYIDSNGKKLMVTNGKRN